MLVHPNSRNTRCIAQPGLMTVFGEVAHFPAVVARVTGRRRLLWWPDCQLLLLLWCWWSAVVLLLLWLLLWAIAPELRRRAARLSRGRGVDHAVLRGSTARTASGGSGHYPLPLLLFGRFTGLHGALLVDGSTCQLIVCQVLGENQAILQLNSEPLAKELGLLGIRINMVGPVLCQIVEFLDILVD